MSGAFSKRWMQRATPLNRSKWRSSHRRRDSSFCRLRWLWRTRANRRRILASLSLEGHRLEDLPSLLNGVGGVSLQILQDVLLSAGPADFYGIRLLSFAETERQGQFALGAITRPGMDGLPVGSTGLIGSLNAHHGA